MNITKWIWAERPVMTRLAVYFISEQSVLISPPTFYSDKAVGYLRLHCTFTVFRRYMALLTIATIHEVVSCVSAQGDCSVSCCVVVLASVTPKVVEICG